MRVTGGGGWGWGGRLGGGLVVGHVHEGNQAQIKLSPGRGVPLQPLRSHIPVRVYMVAVRQTCCVWLGTAGDYT